MYLRLEGRAFLLKEEVAAVASMASKAIIHIGPQGLSLKASEQDSNIMVVLRIDSSSFEGFSWDVDMYGEINPKDLEKILDYEGSVSISSDKHNGLLLEFTFDGYEEHPIDPHYGKIHKSMSLNEVSGERQMIDDLEYESKGFVGIPPEEFGAILSHLSKSGKTVHVSITNSQLTFSTTFQEIVLAKKKGKCTIVGVEEDDQLQFSIGLEHMAAFYDASILSEKVWIVTPAKPESPFMLDCPVEELGHIKFFFPQ